MIQRVQSIYLFFNVLAVLIITYRVPVLSNGTDNLFVTDFLFAHITAIITVLLSIFSILKFKNRSQQIMINQVSKPISSTSIPNTGTYVVLYGSTFKSSKFPSISEIAPILVPTIEILENGIGSLFKKFLSKIWP
jgi:hypothetical protein